jgi:hypothetical protein
MILGAWIVLCVNNITKIPFYMGFDVPGHFDYIDHIATTGRIPLATDGWQMFQAPLYYLLSLPLFLLLSKLMTAENVLISLRVLPMLCGLAQIEIAFRSSRIVFPRRNGLQVIGTVVGGLLPMNIYISQVVGNEPLSGCLTALLICYCFKLLMASSTGSLAKPCVSLGVLFGLALLTKVTAILLLPVLILLICFLALSRGLKPSQLVLPTACFLAAGGVIAGWYYIRNWLVLGQPFVGGWDPIRGISWWQDPGYRVPQDLLSFGEALLFPIHSSLLGFWDGLYSTFWLDGYISAIAHNPSAAPWNYDFMLSMALLSIPMTVALFVGILAAFRAPYSEPQQVKLFAVCCVGLYLVALIYLFITVPHYSAVKGTYTLGLIPCYAVLIASGFNVVIRNRISRAIVAGYLCSWCVFGYVAYFVW